MSKEKVVLAYSGGLDTTAIIPWLKETFGYDVICCCIDCGQGEELDGLDERAKLSGASKLYIENIVDEFAEDFIMPCVKAGAVYERNWWRSHARKAQLPSATVRQEKVTTRSVLSLASKPSPRTSRSSLPGV